MTTAAQPIWTEEELAKFDRLIDAGGSIDQMTRINARIDMNLFIKEHGREKCDAMWAHLQKKVQS